MPKRHIRRSPGENANHLHVRLPLFLERWLEVGPNNCPNFQPPDSDQGSEIQTRVLRSPDRMFLKCGPCRRSAAASPGPTSSYPSWAVSVRSAAQHPPAAAAAATPLHPTPPAPHRRQPSSSPLGTEAGTYFRGVLHLGCRCRPRPRLQLAPLQVLTAAAPASLAGLPSPHSPMCWTS